MCNSYIYFHMFKDIKRKLSTSLVDNFVEGHNFTAFEVYDFKNKCIENIQTLDYIDTTFQGNVTTVTAYHFKADICKLILDMDVILDSNGLKLKNVDISNFTLFFYSLVISFKSLCEYLFYKFASPPGLRYKNTTLDYKHTLVPLTVVKDNMKRGGFQHTSSFLFACQVYSFYKITNVPYVKCKNIYYVPFFEGNNKIIDDVFFVNIPKDGLNEKELFTSIYQQIVSKKKHVLTMWGINLWINILNYNNYLKKLVVFMYQLLGGFWLLGKNAKNKDINPAHETDVCFSNVPIFADVSDIKFIHKSSQPEKTYCFILGNQCKELVFNFVCDVTVTNFDSVFRDCLHLYSETEHS